MILDAGFPGGSTRDVRSVGATTAVQINHGHQQGDGGDQLAEVVHPAEQNDFLLLLLANKSLFFSKNSCFLSLGVRSWFFI